MRSPRAKCVLGVMVMALAAQTGCAAPDDSRRIETRITPDDSKNPKVIRFDVYGDPFDYAPPGSAEAALPVHEQIRLGMRRYAEIRLRELNLCPHGFVGPPVVYADKKNRMHSQFHVECLPAP